MKKMFLIVFIFCSLAVYSQTWVEPSLIGGDRIEWTVITQEQYERLLRQYREDNERCNIYYNDTFTLSGNRVISGTRPNLRGYYYLHGKWWGFMGGWSPVLAFGNSNTGRMEIAFQWIGSRIGVYSNEFSNLYNRYIGRITGE